MKKYIRLYTTAHDGTNINEIQLVEAASDIVGTTLEEFMRGAVLEASRQILVQWNTERQHKAAQVNKTEGEADVPGLEQDNTRGDTGPNSTVPGGAEEEAGREAGAGEG
jgi:hypothetical protein